MSRTASYDVFLSYPRWLRKDVELIAQWLERQGLQVFLDTWRLPAGQSFPELLEKALEDCKAIAIFSGPGDMSRWQQLERNFALQRKVREPEFRVIPVLLPHADPALGFLGQYTWIDLRTKVLDEAQLRKLVAAIRDPPADTRRNTAQCIRTCA